MIAEILPNELILGGIANVVDIPESVLPKLAIVQCLSSFEVQMYLDRNNYWSEVMRPALTSEKKNNIFQVNIDDHPTASIENFFEDVADFIEDRVKNAGKVVLVHCAAGVSRSTSVVVAYLMIKKGMSLKEAITHTKLHRLVMNPNGGFVDALVVLEQRLTSSTTNRQQQASCGGSSSFEEPCRIVISRYMQNLWEQTFEEDENGNPKKVHEENEHCKKLLLGASKYSSSLHDEMEKVLEKAANTDDDDNNTSSMSFFKKTYTDIVAKQYSLGQIVQVLTQPQKPEMDDAGWCPAPVQVGMEEYFKLSKIGVVDNNNTNEDAAVPPNQNGDDDEDFSPDKMTNRTERRRYLAKIFGGEEQFEEGNNDEDDVPPQSQKRRASTANEVLAQYKAMVANAELEIEAEQEDRRRKAEEDELEDWEKELLKNDDDDLKDADDDK